MCQPFRCLHARKWQRFLRCAACTLWVALAAQAGAEDRDGTFPAPGPGERAPQDPVFHDDLQRGLVLIYSDQFETGLLALDSLISAHPDHPGPHFYRAATLQTWMGSHRFNSLQADLERSVDRAIETGTARISLDPIDPWLDFYMGGAYGYRAYFEFERGNYLAAYRDGKHGIAHLRACLQKEPRLYDAYLGLGSYYYWRTARSQVLRWLLFWMADKRALGLDQIELSLRYGQYCRQEARLVLVTALYDDRQFDRARAVLDSCSDGETSHNLFGLYLRGLLEWERNDWTAVEASFRDLDRRLEQSPYGAVGFRVECQFRIARAISELNRKEEAGAMAHSALLLDEKRDSGKELEGILYTYKDIKKDLKHLMDVLDQ
jgi:hypothetical protein